MKLADIKAKVLIIDDDADVRSAVRMTLESGLAIGYAFTEVDNVASGLQAVRSINPDVVILDIHMPGQNGFDFMNKLKKDSLFPQAKIIILTADNSIRNLLRAESKGVNAYNFLGKPFVRDELRALVLSLIIP